VASRTTEIEKAFYKQIADDVHAKTGLAKSDIFVTLVDATREDWSFGNNQMQYAPK
jgi:4-oxalocrotonate tautomerase